jgi:hypothetical protein
LFCPTEELQSAAYKDEEQNCCGSRNGSSNSIHISITNAIPQDASNNWTSRQSSTKEIELNP